MERFDSFDNAEHVPTPPKEESGEADATAREKVEAATDLESLLQIIREIGVVPGSQKDHTAEEIIKNIEEVKNGNKGPSAITRTYGLRDKVIALLRDVPLSE